MTVCEWVINDKGTADATKWIICDREATYTVSLLGSRSAANLAFFCWRHIKNYRKKKFVEDTWGKGAKVEILHIGRENAYKKDVYGKYTVTLRLDPEVHDKLMIVILTSTTPMNRTDWLQAAIRKQLGMKPLANARSLH